MLGKYMARMSGKCT